VSFLDVRTSRYPQLTNIHLSYQTIELFFPVPCSSDLLYSAIIMKASPGNGNRNPKYFPLEVPRMFLYTEGHEK